MSRLVFMYYPGHEPEHLRRFLPKGFKIEVFDPIQQYPADTVFYYDMYGPYEDHILIHLDQGYKVVYDAKNEHYIHFRRHYIFYSFLQHPGQGCIIISGDRPNNVPGVDIIATPYWYWILDQKSLIDNGVDQQVRTWDTNKKFFMSLGLHRVERDYLFDNLGNLLNDSLYSYRHRGMFLPDDASMDVNWQRYVNPTWMNTTAFTLAVETCVMDDVKYGFSLTLDDNHFLCEKTYKPLAAQHPLLLVSTQGNLAYMRSQGFESFPELFDESYDNISDWQKRIDRIIEIVRDFDVGLVNQPIVQEKIKHNRDHFFNIDLVNQLAQDTIQQPLFEFING